MAQKMETISHPPLVWTTSLPPGFKGLKLPGAIITCATGNFGYLRVQEYQDPKFSIRYNVFNIIQRCILRSTSHETGLHTRILFKGNIKNEMPGIDDWSLHRNQVEMLHASSPEITRSYDKHLHTSFDVFFSQKMVDELLPMFPSIAGHFREGQTLNTWHWADGETFEIVQHIFRCRHDNDRRRHFYDKKVRELLFKCLIKSCEDNPAEKQPTEKEREAIFEAEQLINQDISAHFRIPELSKKIGLNDRRLKFLYKKIFGMGPYEYLIKQRMKRAKDLLELGMSVKEVTARLGYRATDFTTAFKNYYGFPPSAVKRKDS